MAVALTGAAVKEYGMNAGASVVGIAASKDFGSAPDGFKPADVLRPAPWEHWTPLSHSGKKDALSFLR